MIIILIIISNMIKKNNFFVFEGIDGSGKSTLISSIFKDAFITSCCIKTQEPFTEEYHNIKITIEEAIKKGDHTSAYLLFSMLRQIHIEKKIIPALDAKKNIISDRFIDSSIVYQGLYIDENFIKNIYHAINTKNIEPDYTFYCKIAPSVALERIKKRGKHDILDTIFEKRLYCLSQRYDDLYKNRKNIIILDMEEPIKLLSEKVTAIIKKIIE